MKYHDRRSGKLVNPSAGSPTASNPRVPDMNTALLNMMQNKSVFGGEMYPGASPLMPESGSSSG